MKGGSGGRVDRWANAGIPCTPWLQTPRPEQGRAAPPVQVNVHAGPAYPVRQVCVGDGVSRGVGVCKGMQGVVRMSPITDERLLWSISNGGKESKG